ncbi:MAG: type II CAAX endopeptidase family protein [Gemmatimonadota bacterium]|nr:type II CAAX endopeptidase family protein [Gemmatimonadota bacterium]
MAYPNLKQSVWLMVLFVVATGILGLVLHFLGAESDNETRIFEYLGWILNLPVFALLVLYAQRRSGRPWSDVLLLRTVPWKMYLPLTVSILGFGIVISDVSTFVQYLIPIPKVYLDIFLDLMGSKTPLGLAFYVLAIHAPLTEEVLCRGVILGGLLAHGTRRRAILWSAVLFAAMHMNPWQFPGSLILGLVFAWWVVQTGSLLPALFGHALNNFLSLISVRMELFRPIEDWGVVEFLPSWLFASGIVLAVIGLRWFHQMAKREGTPLEPQAGPQQAATPAAREPA